VDFQDVSTQILDNEIDRVADSGAVQLVTNCPVCVIQLRGGMDKRKAKIPIRHIAEAVAAEKCQETHSIISVGPMSEGK
jgi:Fe-S oxidoreductase